MHELKFIHISKRGNSNYGYYQDFHNDSNEN